MLERIRNLDGATEFMTWLSMANVIIILAVIVAVAICQCRPPLPWAGAFLITVGFVYIRLTYRNLTEAPVTYAGSLVHVAVTLAGIGMLISVLRSNRDGQCDR